MKEITQQTENLFWEAVRQKDARFDGIFYFGVSTTGVYCRPSCAARPAKRENVEFFATCSEAETRGFRACLRCRPQAGFTGNPQIEIVLRACRLLGAGDFENVSLEALSSKLAVSPTRLQKIFKKILGVSPREYAASERLKKFKTQIKNGEDVASAMYEAGFGSSRALYEKSAADLGMTPMTYKKGGKGMRIGYAVTDCRYGKLLVAATEKGLCAVAFGESQEALTEDLSAEYPQAEISAAKSGFQNYIQRLADYFDGKALAPDLPLDLQATAFQLRVWAELRKIPYGKTVSYKQIAERIGQPKAVRAVARACATNPVALVTPCHRVVRENGDLSGYRWGVERKRELLKNELGEFSN